MASCCPIGLCADHKTFPLSRKFFLPVSWDATLNASGVLELRAETGHLSPLRTPSCSASCRRPPQALPRGDGLRWPLRRLQRAPGLAATCSWTHVTCASSSPRSERKSCRRQACGSRVHLQRHCDRTLRSSSSRAPPAAGPSSAPLPWRGLGSQPQHACPRRFPAAVSPSNQRALCR